MIRYPIDHALQQFGNAQARLRADLERFARVQADDVLDLRGDALRLGLRQVDLVEHRKHFEVLLDRLVAVRDGLCLDALCRIDDEQRALAGGERPGHLVGEIHVAGRVDDVELIVLAVGSAEHERHALRLDGDAAFTLDVHGIEDLSGHLPLRQRSAQLDESIGERRLAVIDVRDDGEIANISLIDHGVRASGRGM